MRIGIDASRANKPKKTGTEWYSYHLIQQFKKIDPDDRFFLYTRERLCGGLELLPQNFSERVLGWWPKYLWTQIRLSWEMLVRPPEVLFVPAHAMPLIAPKNTVVTVHDIGFDRFPKLYKPIQIWYHRFVVRRAVKKARALITVSEFSKKEICSVYGVDPTKVFITHLGYDAGTYRMSDTSYTIQEKYNLKKSYIIFVGRLEEKKNIKRLLEAFARVREQFPTLDLVLVGTPGYGYAQLSSEILNPGIHQLGWIPASDIAGLYRGAQALVFATLYEGFGLPVIEAQASGCPVICSTTTSLPEVGGEAAYYVDPTDVTDIAKGITHVLSDRSLRDRMIRAGLGNVQRFSWEHCARQTLRIIRDGIE